MKPPDTRGDKFSQNRFLPITLRTQASTNFQTKDGSLTMPSRGLMLPRGHLPVKGCLT